MKDAEEIYNSIKYGQPYKTPDGQIIQASEDDKRRFKKEVHNHNVKLNNRYNRLVLDFEDYIQNKNDQNFYLFSSDLLIHYKYISLGG